ncbi:hypothetical protein ACTXM3_08400 [Glutamicibacter arilaitensis]|uniref:hypothetical protein n=1 Tax=Glutamicibacter arilaitensis TaxID=256701 RepID=UPI003FD0C443
MSKDLLIEPRSIQQIADDIRRGVTEKPLSPWQPHVRWTAKDAGLMCDRMREFFQSPYALFTMAHLTESGNFTFAPGYDPTRASTQRYLDFWASNEVMVSYLDDATADMVLAASLSAPADQLHEDELLAPRGIVFFENPTTVFSEIYDDLEDADVAPVRAISWELPVESGEKLVALTTFFDGSETSFVEPPIPGLPEEVRLRMEQFTQKTATYLSIGLINNFKLNDLEKESNGSSQLLIRYLRALSAIARSPRTDTTTKAITVAKRKKGKRTYTRERNVTVVSLQRPETAQYELDGARGRIRQRAHWVRGHWRNQWYATVEDHRPKWIDGFMKGDPEKGTVQTRKVVKL